MKANESWNLFSSLVTSLVSQVILTPTYMKMKPEAPRPPPTHGGCTPSDGACARIKRPFSALRSTSLCVPMSKLVPVVRGFLNQLLYFCIFFLDGAYLDS